MTVAGVSVHPLLQDVPEGGARGALPNLSGRCETEAEAAAAHRDDALRTPGESVRWSREAEGCQAKTGS